MEKVCYQPVLKRLVEISKKVITSWSKYQNNVECARGLASFSSIEIEKIKGFHSSEIKNILGYSSREEIIHKDDLVKV